MTIPSESPTERRTVFTRFANAISKYAVAPYKFVFASAFVWHSLAVRSFTMTPFAVLRATTTTRPISFISGDILQYLGGLNIGYAVLCLQSLFLPPKDLASRKRNALVLAAGGLSQLWFTVRFYSFARWNVRGMMPIFIGDAFITLISLLYYFQHDPDEE